MTMITRKSFLQVFPIFRQAPEQLVDEIFGDSVCKGFKNGDFLYIEGDSCPGIGFVLSGSIRVYKVSESGRELTLYEIFPGETCVMNASCIISQKHYPANAVALSDGALLYLSKQRFVDFLSRYEAMRVFIFSYFSQRFTTLIELIEAVTFGKMDRRLSDYLVEKAENNVLKTTHQSIANDLGTSREVISRLLKDLEHRGDIRVFRNKIELVELY